MDKITDDNGKTVKKYGVKKVRQLHYDTTYWNAVHTGMRGVVSGKDSSVSSIFQGMKVKLAGKTGTAQENKKRPNHALFISYGPYEKPEITTTVVIPFGYTSSNAAATAKDIYEYYFAYDKTKKTLEKNQSQKPVLVLQEIRERREELYESAGIAQGKQSGTYHGVRSRNEV